MAVAACRTRQRTVRSSVRTIAARSNCTRHPLCPNRLSSRLLRCVIRIAARCSVSLHAVSHSWRAATDQRRTVFASPLRQLRHHQLRLSKFESCTFPRSPKLYSTSKQTSESRVSEVPQTIQARRLIGPLRAPQSRTFVRPIEDSEENMKSKALILASTLLMALALMAQSTSQSTPAPADNNAKSCACCDQAKTDGKMACCGKGATCCAKSGDCCKKGACQSKDGKGCPMMSKDASGKMACCADGKCSMASNKDGKGCCGGGKMCARPQSGA